jgi:hypothetical protein
VSEAALAETESCARCDSPLEEGDLRCAVCALPAPLQPRTAIPGAKVLRCTGCGAAIAFDANHEAPACAFCRAVLEVEQPVDPIEVARLRVPFSVDRDAATVALRGWLRTRGWFAPKQLHDEATLESIAPLGWAAWIVNAKAEVAWACDSDEGARRSAWAPHAGRLTLELGDLAIPASRGLTDDECAALVPYYDLKKATSTPADEVVEAFDAQRSAARKQIQRAIERVARTHVQQVAPGRRFRNVHVACLLERQTTERVALPAWVLAYRYRGAPYRAIVHGQRADVVVGNSPVDWGKVAKLVAGALAVAATIIAIVLALR